MKSPLTRDPLADLGSLFCLAALSGICVAPGFEQASGGFISFGPGAFRGGAPVHAQFFQLSHLFFGQPLAICFAAVGAPAFVEPFAEPDAIGNVVGGDVEVAVSFEVFFAGSDALLPGVFDGPFETEFVEFRAAFRRDFYRCASRFCIEVSVVSQPLAEREAVFVDVSGGHVKSAEFFMVAAAC